MKQWQEAGAELILLTMRSDHPIRGPVLTDAVEFCRDNGVEFLYVNCNPEQDHWTDSRKVLADLYVDDAGFGIPLTRDINTGFLMVDWAVVGPAVLSAIQEWKPRYA